MSSPPSALQLSTMKYKNFTRRGRKVNYPDQKKILPMLSKDISDKTWIDLLQKEESDQFIFDIREELMDHVMNLCCKSYLKNQAIQFTVHCTAKACLKLIDWFFFVHDPGEDPSALSLCDIPNRAESWEPDDMPEPSPKDAWSNAPIDFSSPVVPVEAASYSVSYVEEVSPIPSIYWFPGRVESPDLTQAAKSPDIGIEEQDEEVKPEEDVFGEAATSGLSSDTDVNEEVLEKVVEYNVDDTPPSKVSSSDKMLPMAVEVEEEEREKNGGGDAHVIKKRNRSFQKKKPLSSKREKSKKQLLVEEEESTDEVLFPSKVSMTTSAASRCRERTLRTVTNYETTAEELIIDNERRKRVKRR